MSDDRKYQSKILLDPKYLRELADEYSAKPVHVNEVKFLANLLHTAALRIDQLEKLICEDDA